ncbi:unnamed protein product [Clonostachys byssicola]|uniref:Uncharacterized protein n=1 Tax=Clonostachys byssicola TaxID=160290 RepID=A0A9N9Y2I5_9HYPO|nr:unnamed protein product [Clonostachys byssicola]
MAVPDVPNWARVILLIAIWTSFGPQLHRLKRKRESSGISLWYILFNLLNATEQFAFSVFFSVNDENGLFTHKSQTTGDWINLVQFAGVFVLWFTISGLSLRLPSDDTRRWPKITSSTLFGVAVAAVVPLFVPRPNSEPGEGSSAHDVASLFSFIHSRFLFPIITLLSLGSLIPQVRTTRSRQHRGALSLSGLAVQGVLFLIDAFAWVGRLEFPWDEFDGSESSWKALLDWYQGVGWVPVNNGLSALVKMLILSLTIRHWWRRDRREERSGETEPLLA